MRKTFIKLMGLMLLTLSSSIHSQTISYTDFEAEALCGTSCAGSCNPTGDWRNADQWGFLQAGTDWLVEDGSTPSTDTGPDVDHTLGSASGHYLYVETSGCNNTSAHLVSTIFDFSALTAPKIKFYYHMYGATMGTMHLDVDTTGLGDWVLDTTTPWTANSNTWQLTLIDLSAFAGYDSVRLRIRGQTGTSFTSDMAVDDIEIFEPQAYDVEAYQVTNPLTGCGLGIENLCVSFINYGFDTIAIGDSLQFTAIVNNGTPLVETFYISSNILPGDTSSFCFTPSVDLSASGTFNIKIGIHHQNDISLSNDTAYKTVTNIPLYSTFPVLEDFEGGQNGWLITNNALGTWAFGTPSGTVINSAASGINAFRTGGLAGSYNDLDNSYVQAVCYDFTNVCDPTVSLKVWWNAEFSWDGANITTSTDGGSTWQLAGAFGDPANWYTDNTIVGTPGGYQSGWSGRQSTGNGSNGWVTATHKLTGLAGQSDVLMRINFATDGSVTDEGFAFDDVLIFDGVYLSEDFGTCGNTVITALAGPETPNTFSWNTGDNTASTTADTTGYYSVTYNYGACTISDSLHVTYIDTVNSNYAQAGPDVMLCDSTVSLNAPVMDYIDWIWSTGDTASTTTMNGEISTLIYLTGISNLAGCADTSYDSVQVDLLGANSVNIDDISSCGAITMDAGPLQSTYDWSNGDTIQTTDIYATQMLVIEVTDADGCSATDSALITINTIPTVDLGTDFTLCNTDTFVLDAGSGFNDYQWSGTSSDTTQTTVADGSQLSINTHDYFITITDSNGCTNSDDITITVVGVPSVNLGADLVLCNDSNIALDASSGFSSYLWNTTETTQTILVDGTVLGTGAFPFNVTVSDANGCFNSDTLNITFADCSGIDENVDYNIHVYPNPADEFTFVSIQSDIEAEINIRLLNQMGQLVMQMAPANIYSGNQMIMIDVSTFAPGLYFIETISGDQKTISRLMIK